MHDLLKKTSLYNAYFLSLHNKNKNVMGRKVVTNYPFTHLKIAEGFYNFKPQHCPHLVIFIIEYFDLFWIHKCKEWPLFYNIAILQLKKFYHKCAFWKKYYVNLANFSQKALSHILNPT